MTGILIRKEEMHTHRDNAMAEIGDWSKQQLLANELLPTHQW